MHGMSPEQTAVVKKLATALKTQPFTIGLAADKASVDAKVSEKMFPDLCALGVLRCPVNDGGMALYELSLEVVQNIGS